jgi:hypothetical protein
VTAIRFQTADGLSLEGELRFPDEPTRGTAVICHPDPRDGGSKDHPLLWAIRNDLAGRRGLVVLGFNFRGVMGSEGTHAEGVDEVQDVAAAVARVRLEAEGPTVLVGWSFGAHVALRYALAEGEIGGLALIGLPLEFVGRPLPPLPTREELRDFATPTLLLVGEADPFCPVPALRSLARKIRGAETVALPDTDHFFPRREGEAARVVGEFVDRVLGKD